MEDNNNQVTTYHQKGNHGFRTDRVVVRKFESADYPDVERIFIDGLMEMVPDTAFTGLKHHPESLLLYAAMTIVCCIATKSFLLTCLVPLAVLCARYYYSRKVVLGYLERAKLTDMGDIEGHYIDPCLWVAVLEGSVVGVVVACALLGEPGTVELHRMSVDRCCRQRGFGVARGWKVLQFAADRGYLSVVLGTTAYLPAAYQLYQTLGFRCVGVTKGYATPGVSRSVPEQLFYRVSHHHYLMDMTVHKTNTHSQH
ncbi:N-acetylaspartate synthetase-like [Salvelinus fontinalis]|uniref:N-acetylaspartate synthetase-like n=1 Tax=Salvelinus fontinalis TaxID=8038 RepID=UPI0024865E82|nr:N-acetylaspartate synthetase-like [Salvelinus fontinalis]